MRKRIKFLVMDVDGTLTDGKIYMGDYSEIYKVFDVKDGYAIYHYLPENYIKPIIITGRSSHIVESRCKELKIREYYQDVSDKLRQLTDSIMKNKSSFNYVAYIGDDVNDLPCIKSIKECGGLTACPSDASREVIEEVDYVCEKSGGNGAVREFIEYIINEYNTKF